MSTAGATKATNDRAALIQQAFRLEYITLAWILPQCGVPHLWLAAQLTRDNLSV
jgi:hypothetical protein